MTTNPQERFYELAQKYNNFIEPLESWETIDLADLETLVNTELQERERAAVSTAEYCACPACQVFNNV